MGDQKSGNATSPPSEPPIIPLGPWCIAKIKRKLQQRRAKREKETSQERSSRITAVATGVIAFFAIVAAGVGISQAIISYRQLNAMQDQLNEMRTAAALTRAQLRANIEVLSFDPKLETNGDWTIQIIWRNHGPTDADGFEQWTSWGIYTPDIPADFDFFKPANVLQGRHAMTLAGNAPIRGEPARVPADRIQTVASGTSKFYAWGDASYKDIFSGEIHHTHFCSNVIVTNIKSPGFATFDAYKPECNYAN